jgi:hypothetical protein
MKILSPTLYAAIALSLAFSVSAPAVAAPLSMPTSPVLSSDIVNVEYRSDRRKGHKNSRRSRRDGFRHSDNGAYFNNHRGYRERRRGYRQHNGFWFPPAAFLAGAIINNAVNNGDYGDPHYRWCNEQYRSYRNWDNSFQPYGGGGRRECDSPYG